MEFFLFSQDACIMPRRIDQLFAYLLHLFFSLFLRRSGGESRYVLSICLLFPFFKKHFFTVLLVDQKKNPRNKIEVKKKAALKNELTNFRTESPVRMKLSRSHFGASRNKRKLNLIKNEKGLNAIYGSFCFTCFVFASFWDALCFVKMKWKKKSFFLFSTTFIFLALFLENRIFVNGILSCVSMKLASQLPLRYFYFFFFFSDFFLPHKNQRFSGEFWQNSITIRVVSMLIRFLFCNKTMSSVWLCSGDKHLNWVAILFKFIHEPNPRGYKNLSTLRLSGIAKSFLSLHGKSPLELHKSLGINKILLGWLWGQATRELHIETAFWLNFYPTK